MSQGRSPRGTGVGRAYGRSLARVGFRRFRNRRLPRGRSYPSRVALAGSCLTEAKMSDILTEHSGFILRLQFNRPEKKNAITSGMYTVMAELLNDAAKDDRTRVVLWHGSGDSFCAGNDLEDFIKNPPGPGESPQSRLERALTNFDKPLVAAVHGAAIGGGTTMLTHCDFVFAGDSTKFQLPFINLGLVPEFGSSCSIPARFGYI